MLKNKVIIIPLVTDWDWTADYIRQTARVLEKDNQVIVYDQHDSSFFLKTNLKKEYPKYEHISFIQPRYYIPGRRFKCVDRLNQQVSFLLLLLKYLFQQKVVWIFDPELFYLTQIRVFGQKNIYDCVDFHSSLDRKRDKVIRSNEVKLITNVDLFFVNSHALEQRHNGVGQKPIYLSAQGFSVPALKPSMDGKRLLGLVPDKPVIGFVGGVNYRLDFPLIYQLVKNNLEWQFVFFGPYQSNECGDKLFRTRQWIERLHTCPNVYWGEAKDRNIVYEVINCFDVAMIPYNLKIPFNQYCYPMKLFEYFYFGKPVISTPIKELSRKEFQGLIRIGTDSVQWQNEIEQIIRGVWQKDQIQMQRKLSLDNRWKIKLEEMSCYL